MGDMAVIADARKLLESRGDPLFRLSLFWISNKTKGTTRRETKTDMNAKWNKLFSHGLAVIVSSSLVAAFATPAFAAHEPGTAPRKQSQATTNPASGNSLAGFYSATGRIYLSTDGAGTNRSSATVDVQKRSSQSRVRAAYLLAASAGFTGSYISDGEVSLNGIPVDFDETTGIFNSIGSFNIRGDVTSIVKPLLDSAPIGITTLSLVEARTFLVDGEILAVVFDDPNEPETSVNLFYGAQATTGDQFNILLGSPVQAADANQQLTLALGISYGFQQGTGRQFSQIDVNGVRLTTSAGGDDDSSNGFSNDGALITVGGLGDSTANPADPLSDGVQLACSPFCDDELYDLKAVLADGTTAIQVNTLNPSNDDNIFFASLVSKGNVAIVNEGILATPSLQTRQVGQSAVVTALIQDVGGNPVPARTVTFATVGPNRGSPTTASTDSGGAADFTLRCSVAGSNTVVGSFVDSNGARQTSNTATVVCQPGAVAREICNNRIDDDGDGLIDANDPDCAAAGDLSCNGLRATIVGTNASELLVGTPGNDIIVGRGGRDVIVGRGGADTICAGDGADLVFGNDGDDAVSGGNGNDVIILGDGADRAIGDGGRDIVNGGNGSDLCSAEIKFGCP